MTTDPVLVEQQGACLTLTLNRPDKQNALTQQMYELLIAAMQSALANADIRLVLLKGAGEHFTAGNDIADFLAADKPIEELGAVRWLRALSEFPKPVIAAVQGNAIGIGTTCLLHCDLIIAAQNARFAMPFTKLGLCPEAGVSLLLPRLAGYPKAAELLLLGSDFNANDALTMGLVNRVVTNADLQQTTAEMTEQLSQLPPESVRLTKALLRRPEEAVSERMTEEFRLFEQQLHSDAAREIFKQFLKR